MLKKSSCLAPALNVTKFIIVTDMSETQQTHLCSQFGEQKLMLSSSFRHEQIQNCQRNYFCHTLLCYLSRTQRLNKPTSEAGVLIKGSCLARALVVTKFIKIRDVILVTL